MTDQNQPVAVPYPPALPAAAAPATVAAAVQIQGGTNTLPPAQGTAPNVDGFSKLSAELRSADAVQSVVIPFGRTESVRIYAEMPASFALSLADSTVDPMAAFRAIREAIIDEDKPVFDRVKGLSPENEHGITGAYLVGLVMQLSEFYGGRPLAG